MCGCVDVLLSGRFVVLTVDDSLRFRLFVQWYLFFNPQVLSARIISVADSYCNVFAFVLFFCARLFVRSWARVLFRSFIIFFARLFFGYFGHVCIGLTLFVPGWCFGAFALCDVCRCYLLVTTLRVHPAVTRLTVYRRPYLF